MNVMYVLYMRWVSLGFPLVLRLLVVPHTSFLMFLFSTIFTFEM